MKCIQSTHSLGLKVRAKLKVDLLLDFEGVNKLVFEAVLLSGYVCDDSDQPLLYTWVEGCAWGLIDAALHKVH